MKKNKKDKTNKLIGIPAWDLKADEHFGVSIPYLAWIDKFGIPVIITPDYMPAVDMIVLPGGGDVDTARYGETPEFYTSKPNIFLEHFDVNILPQYIDNNTPIFGICRGLQTLNVLGGGSLFQDIDNHPTSKYVQDLVHDVFEILPDGTASKTVAFKSGSWHHQAVKKLAPGYDVLLVAEDSHVEAIKHREKPIFAVQYHPERMNDEFSEKIMRFLLGQTKDWK